MSREPLCALPLRSYKLRFDDVHVRVVPEGGECPFEGPGVDLLGSEAESILAEASAVSLWFSSREPGTALRSLSFDRGRGRILATIRHGAGPGKPHVLRIEEGAAPDLFELLLALEPRLSEAAARVLARRPTPPG